jgi:hypothetical protein
VSIIGGLGFSSCCWYEDCFDGVLLAHEFILLDQNAKILNGLVPYFGVPVSAILLLFSPQPDMILGMLLLVTLSVHTCMLRLL